MTISLQQVSDRLINADDILILSHQSPDGDTLGSASALLLALSQMGKRVRFECSDPVPKRFAYLFQNIPKEDFKEKYIISVDIADVQLFGKSLYKYVNKVDLCIDHHGTNGHFAKESYVESDAAATAEIIYKLLENLPITINSQIASCLYTGICTDTGCFRYSNTTPATHIMAAKLMEQGADTAEINRKMFDTKSRTRMEVERRVLDSMTFHCGGKCAVMVIERSIVEETGADESELDGLSSLPRQIEGVLVGVCIREKPDNVYKISVRTTPPADAAAICEKFGGGGHHAAAGCAFSGISLEEVKKRLIDEIGKVLENA